MKKLFSVTLVFALILALSALILVNRADNSDNTGRYIVAINEIKQLSAVGDMQKAEEKADELIAYMNDRSRTVPVRNYVIAMCAVDLVILASMSLYCGMKMIRPFSKLTDFAEKIAKGDMDIPLEYERTNYFGKFTWAFDNMRREITKARSCEKEAIENNKTVIASLSHDIKTPAASIRAYAEALKMGMDGDPEKRSRYLEVIMRKCDEVAKLTNDMFLHSLSDLDKLKINPEKFEICSFTEDVINDLCADGGDISYQRPYFSADVNADKGRTAQMIENLINNARKYAKTKVDISLTKDSGFVYIHFRDHGKGIPDEDMPFIFDKFYRGRNCGDEAGSGLGLFIVKYITQQTGGDIVLKNHPDGLEPRFHCRYILMFSIYNESSQGTAFTFLW